jgi:cell division protein FtsI/penicillin-binding protein 2
MRSFCFAACGLLAFFCAGSPSNAQEKPRSQRAPGGVVRAQTPARSLPSRVVPLPAAILSPDPTPRDLAVGEACRKGLGGIQGSVVAMDPWTGRVISIVNPVYGMLNAYQPCSVFKIVTAIAGLSEGVITPDTTFVCSKNCWSWPGHGSINLKRALAVSCNPYFQQVGEQLGFEKMQKYAQLLGLGAPTGINVTGETPGLFPSLVRPEGMALLSSHAEGVKTSPVQIAALLSAAINGGILFQPQVASAVGFEPKERWRLPEGTSTAGMAEGFMGAVNEGSAAPAFDPDIVVAGKTGSCSHVGWFASYAPADKPEVVIVVFMRSGNGHGASAIAGRIYQELYKTAASAPAAP